MLDAGGLSRLAERSTRAAALIRMFRREGLWPPVVPSVVLVESLTGRAGPDANVNRLIKTCELVNTVPEALARRASALRHHARRGSAVDAIIVATAEPGGTVLTSDVPDVAALASQAHDVFVERA